MRRAGVRANRALPRGSGADKGAQVLEEEGHIAGHDEGDADPPRNQARQSELVHRGVRRADEDIVNYGLLRQRKSLRTSPLPHSH